MAHSHNHHHERRTLKRGSNAGDAFPPEVRKAFQTFLSDYNENGMKPMRGDLVAALEDGDIDPTTMRSLRAEVRPHIMDYQNDVEVVWKEGTESAAEAGRQVASRRYPIDVDFSMVPQAVLDEFATWSSQMSGAVLETITDDVTALVRGAHKEGLAIPDIAEQVNDLFDNQLTDWQATRTARTATISSSNAGTHSAYQDADSVVGTEWLATSDSRTRATHSAADGQVISPNGMFSVGGSQARYPGDPSLPVREVANCRCTTIPRFADQFTQSQLATLTAGGRLADA